MKTEQLILYRDFEEGDLLTDMVWLAENYADDFYNLSDKAGLLYDCMHRLLEGNLSENSRDAHLFRL